MLKKVQSFFLNFKKKCIFLLILFYLSNIIQNPKFYAYDFFLSPDDCSKENIFPNIKFFKRSSLRTTLFEPVCKDFKAKENYYPMVIDGVSSTSPIIIKTECIFDKNKIPLNLSSNNPYFVLWDSNHNQLHSLSVRYNDKKQCGLIIFPEKKLSEGSFYLFLFRKRVFYDFLKQEYKLNIKKYWEDFKETQMLRDLDKDQEKMLKSIIKLYSDIFYFNPDENVYSVFPVRSYSGIFAPFLYFRNLRKEELDIDIKEIEENLAYKIKFKEKKKNAKNIKIYYMGIEDLDYNINYDYTNYFLIYVPKKIQKENLNVIISNGDIVSLPFFRNLAEEKNLVLISYYVFDRSYINFINDIFLYDNIDKILQKFLVKYNIKNIYKICFFDKECIVSTFYQNKIKKVFIHNVPDYIIDSFYKNYYYDVHVNKNLFINRNLTSKEILNLLSTQLEEDLLRINYYMENKEKLIKYLNYQFDLYKINFLFNKEEYKID